MFSNSMMTAVETAVTMVMVIIATPALIENFGVASYGAFVFLNIFSIYGALFFFDLGMEGSLTTYIARYDASSDRKKMQQSLVVAILYYGTLGALVGLGLLFASDFIAYRFVEVKGELSRDAVKAALHILSVNVLLQFLALPFVAVLQGLRRYVLTKSVNTIATVIQYTLIIIVSYYHGSIDKAFLVVTCMSLARLLFYLGTFTIGIPQFRPMSLRVELSQLRVLVSYSSVLFVCRILGLVNNNVHKLAIWLYMPVTNLAIYDVVVKPSNALRVPDTVAGTSIIPEVARLHALGRKDEIAGMYIRLIRYTYLVLVPMVVFLAVFISHLLRIWVGEQFVPYAWAVYILLFAFLLAPVSSQAFLSVVGLERIRNAIWISIVGTALNATLSLTLLHYLGLAGLLLATVTMYAFMFWPYIRQLARHVGLRPTTVVAAIGKTLGLAAPFAGAYLLVEHFLSGRTLIMLGVAAVIGIAHLAAEYHWLLNGRERDFVGSRLGLGSRFTAEPSTHVRADQPTPLNPR
ncbi:MAG: polysaccharide biosynthesis C-terminal domain-containing protein [Candidatus Zixiibacteriota bacterium]